MYFYVYFEYRVYLSMLATINLSSSKFFDARICGGIGIFDNACKILFGHLHDLVKIIDGFAGVDTANNACLSALPQPVISFRFRTTQDLTSHETWEEPSKNKITYPSTKILGSNSVSDTVWLNEPRVSTDIAREKSQKRSEGNIPKNMSHTAQRT